MESPLKKRKIASQESQGSKVTSTPQREPGNYREQSPSISRIVDESSSITTTSSSQIGSRKKLDFFKLVESTSAEVSDQSSLAHVIEKNYSITEESEDDGENILDYDEFFNTLTRFQRKGHVWNLFKPIGEEEGSLYYLILNEPKGTEKVAKWFVTYCQKATIPAAVYLLYKFCLDCAGYQKTNIKRHFTNPLPSISNLVEVIMNKVENEECEAEVFTTGKFLFAEKKSVMATILQMGIYNFVQKFVFESHDQDLLYKETFIRLLKLVEAMCKASYRQLMYTGVVFMLKLLTAICMVKRNLPDTTDGGRQDLMLDNYINTLYINGVKACRTPDSDCTSLKLSCINELRAWIHCSPKVFIDHYNSTVVLGKLILDEFKTVRLAALEAFRKLVQNEHLVEYLQVGPIEHIVSYVTGRFCDVDITVALKALEVYTDMITDDRCNTKIPKKTLEDLVDFVYHKDYRMGSAACKCIIAISNKDRVDENNLLLDICRLSMNHHSGLKPLLVESCFDNTKVLQNWNLIVKIFVSPHSKNVPDELKEALSELFLESVHQVLTGLSSKVRAFSRRVEEIELTHHKSIADEIYPHLTAILPMYRKEPLICGNILRIATKIKPEYLDNTHIEAAEKFLQYLMKFFVFWSATDTLTALLDFLVFLNDHVPRLSTTTRNTIEDLKKYVSEELYKSFKSRDTHTILIANKTAVTFSKFDLNENIEWSKLLASWDIIECNAEYLENMMKCCHWSLIWKIRKLSSALYTKSEQSKYVSSLSTMSNTFFFNCMELMGHEDRNIKFKVFVRFCETHIAFCTELENISKQIRSLEDLKRSMKDDPSQKQIIDIFELSVGTCEDSVAQKYAMYIVNMAFLNILSMECISVIFKYYDKNYETYGKLIESVMSFILNKNDNWMPILLINAICLCFEKFLAKHGSLDIRSQEAKDILSLSRKFAECKVIKQPKIASKVLFYAINYAVDTASYEFLIFARVFINEIYNIPDRRKEILEHLKKKVPKSHTKNDSVLYFGEHLAKAGREKTKPAERHGKQGRPKAPNPPKLKIKTVKILSKDKENVIPRKSSQTTDSEVSVDVTIHDTSSDDLEENMSGLNISG